MNQIIRSERELSFDVRAGFLPLCEVVKADAGKLFLELSTFGFESMFMTKGQQIRYLNNVFKPKDKLNVPANKLIRNLKICPECEQEDEKEYGEPYIHRSHQLPGVCTCYKHKCLLKDYRDKNHKGKVLQDSLVDLNAYTSYVQKLFEAKLETDIVAVKKIILKKKQQLTNVKLKKIYKQKDTKSWIEILMVLFPDPDNFVCEISNESLIEKYICENCGEIYYMSPSARQSGWDCPYCKTSVEETFQRLVETMGKGEYTLEGVFESLDRKVLFYHKLCDQKQEMKPRKFLFEEQWCSCTYRVTEAEARQRIEEYKGFSLVEFRNTLVPVTIFHEDCGRDFPCNYKKFLQFPGCRCCKPSYMTEELYAQRVYSLVGEEYSIIQGFVDQHTKVHIRHNPCGNIHPYKPSAFLDGQRCKECCKQISLWQDMFQLLLEYKDLYGNTCIAKREAFKERPLGQWCNRQRALYKKGSLKKNREQQLLGIGFLFNPLDAEWYRRYEQYKRYIALIGSCAISKRTDFEGEHLGAWVATQRKCYKNKKLSIERTLLMRELDCNAFA